MRWNFRKLREDFQRRFQYLKLRLAKKKSSGIKSNDVSYSFVSKSSIDTVEKSYIDDPDFAFKPQITSLRTVSVSTVKACKWEPFVTDQECIVCMSSKANVLIVPCMHTLLCYTCLAFMIAQQRKTYQDTIPFPPPLCPICRGQIEKTFRISNRIIDWLKKQDCSRESYSLSPNDSLKESINKVARFKLNQYIDHFENSPLESPFERRDSSLQAPKLRVEFAQKPKIRRLYSKNYCNSGYSTPSEPSLISQSEERVTHAISYLINRPIGTRAPLACFDTPFSSDYRKIINEPSPLKKSHDSSNVNLQFN